MKTMRVLLTLILGAALQVAGAGAPVDVASNDAARALPPLVAPAMTNLVAFFAAGAEYLVIDLSGGTDALQYLMHFLPAVPVGGWTDDYRTNKLVLRRIPVTTNAFLMGSPDDEIGRFNDETQHSVILTRIFFLGVFPVTQRQWELVMGDRPSYFNNETYYAKRPVEQVSFVDIRGDDDGAQWPMTSAVDNSSFLGVLRKKTAIPLFDLPTEAQREYACRAGTISALNTGNNLTSVESDQRLDNAARYWANSRNQQRQGCSPDSCTAIVGSYLPNAWGLYDMHGNVWEWCLDWYGTYPGVVPANLSGPPGTAPRWYGGPVGLMATNPVGPSSGAFRVLRGGAWTYAATYCRSAFRYYYGDGGTGGTSKRCYDFGFRLALTLPEAIRGESEGTAPTCACER